MKNGIHPHYSLTKVSCICGHSFETRSSIGEEMKVEICSNCHPFFTGKQKLVDTAGRVERYRQKYGVGNKDKKTAPKAADGQ